MGMVEVEVSVTFRHETYPVFIIINVVPSFFLLTISSYHPTVLLQQRQQPTASRHNSNADTTVKQTDCSSAQ